MFGSDVRPREISSMSSAPAGGDGIELIKAMKDQHVETTGGAIVSESTLLKGLKAKGNVSVSKTVVQEGIESSGGGITANDSTFQDIKSRKKVFLKDCAADSVYISLGDLEWNNNAIKEKCQCKRIEVYDEINLENITAFSVESRKYRVVAKNCNLGEVQARDEVELTDTSAQVVNVPQGSLTIIAQDKKIASYNNLKAQDDITLTNIEATSVKSDQGTIVAKDCVFNTLEGNQSIRLERSVVSQSIVLNVDPSKPCQLFLNGSTIGGNIIIKAYGNNESKAEASGITITPGLHALASALSKGTEVKMGFNLTSYTVNNDRGLEKESKLVTFEEIKQQIFRTFGRQGNYPRLNFNDGVYRVMNEHVEIIKAPPNLASHVTVVISGGTINGKVIFKNCEGECQLLDGAVIMN